MPTVQLPVARYLTPRRAALSLTALLLATVTVTAVAQEREDTRRMLEMSIERQGAEREREILKDETTRDQRPTLTIDGQTYEVDHTASALGQALYLSLQHQQWQAANRFLQEYLTLADRDPLLEHYARGILARVVGDNDTAIAEFRKLLAQQPDFILGRLELARTLFDDAQEREAKEAFADALAIINARDPQTAGVRKTIGAYQQALEKRSDWNGSFSFGPSWSDNVNRTSASRTCLISDSTGFCYYERALPEALKATGTDFDFSVQRRLAIKGHHGVYLRSLLYGTQYRNHGEFNETTVTLQGGYSYRDARQQLMLAPSFEYYEWGNDAMYGAPGVHGEWSYMLSSASLVKLEADYKDMQYRRADYARNFDGAQQSLYGTWYRELTPGWTVFGGLDFVNSHAEDPTAEYQQKGVRLGASLRFDAGFDGTLSASYRQRDYELYNPLIEVRRRDQEQNYTLVLRAPRWELAGFVPSLTLRHNRVKSNADWIYSYNRNDASLKLEYSF